MATAPVAVLEVGCGLGAFLKDAAQRGCRVAGLEVDNDLVAELQKTDIDARFGRAEELPFDAMERSMLWFSSTFCIIVKASPKLCPRRFELHGAACSFWRPGTISLSHLSG
jgi:SAM-dependent methyltransferase